jgi:CubicO group peptidase (beta-lactamase class C family)
MKRSIMLLALTPAIGFAQAPRNLDSFVESIMKEFTVPGVAIAIVKDGKPVVTKGYGVRSIGKPDRVDARTNFGIASNTKIFTATALGLLVEEGEIEWDAPVIRYMPAFAMYDPFVTRELTVRDLLVHRSGLGLGAGDLLWWPESTYDRKEIVQRLRYIKPATSFRSAYAYDNVLYTVAGELIEAVSGKRWEDFVTERILRPVGMTGSTVLHSAAGTSGNIAGTHAFVDGVLKPVPPMTSDNTNPAGGINSSAEDMAKWLIVQLDSGRLPDGKQLFRPTTTRQLWTIVTPQNPGNPAPELVAHRTWVAGYALGLGVRSYRGRQMLTHTGGLPGYLSKVTMLPDLKLGIAVLTNQESGAAFDAISYHIVDHYLGVDKPIDYLAAYRAIDKRSKDAFARMDRETGVARDTSSRPSLPVRSYAGTYRDAWYGDVVISQAQNGKLEIRFAKTPSLVGDLEHWQHDTFIARWHDRTLRADAFVTFSLLPDGRIDEAKMLPASPTVDFSFDFQDLVLRPVTDRP